MLKLVGNELLNLYNGITLKQIFGSFKLNSKYLNYETNKNIRKVLILKTKKTICTTKG